MRISAAELADWGRGTQVNAEVCSASLDQTFVSRIAPLAQASSQDLAFFFQERFLHDLASARPTILWIGNTFVDAVRARPNLWQDSIVIASQNPYLSMALLSEVFAKESHHPIAQETTIHPTAVVSDQAKLGEGVSIGPHCTVEAGVVIGDRTVLKAGCTLAEGTRVGVDCLLFPRVTCYAGTVIGNRVRIHAGAVIGSDGFGYVPNQTSFGIQGHQKIFHLGTVVIADDVEIGANTCIDRGTFGSTRIDSHVKLDNLVHIGHNSSLAEGALVCGGSCLAGNASLGQYAVVGGLTGIDNQVHVGAGGKVGALTMVTKDVPPGGTAVGNPQRTLKDHLKSHALLNRMLSERSKS